MINHLSETEFNKRVILQVSCLEVETNISGKNLEFIFFFLTYVRTLRFVRYKNMNSSGQRFFFYVCDLLLLLDYLYQENAWIFLFMDIGDALGVR